MRKRTAAAQKAAERQGRMNVEIQLRWDVDALRIRLEEGGARAVRAAAEELLEESRRQAPSDTGALQRSGRADAEGWRAAVHYDAPHAVRCHEGNFRFRRGRKARYLADPCHDAGMQRRAAERMAREIRL